jgi:hypothetical protein
MFPAQLQGLIMMTAGKSLLQPCVQNVWPALQVVKISHNSKIHSRHDLERKKSLLLERSDSETPPHLWMMISGSSAHHPCMLLCWNFRKTRGLGWQSLSSRNCTMQGTKKPKRPLCGKRWSGNKLISSSRG